jgi:hypothetical protein
MVKPTLNVLEARHRLAPIEGQKENKAMKKLEWKQMDYDRHRKNSSLIALTLIPIGIILFSGCTQVSGFVATFVGVSGFVALLIG